MLRVAGSLVTSQVRAYDLLRMLGRDGHPTALGQAFAEYGLWNTRCTDAALVWLRGQRQEATDEDAARLSPLADAHINMCWAGTPSPAAWQRPARRADRMARLQDRVVRVAETRGEVALDKLDRSAPIMRSLR